MLDQVPQISTVPSGVTRRGMAESHAALDSHLKDRHTYLYILVKITLDFIRAEDGEIKPEEAGGLVPTLASQTTSVNASACEFLDLLLKRLNQFHGIANQIAHLIMEPLVHTFSRLIQSQNHAMQVNIINLLELILNHCSIKGYTADEQQGALMIDSTAFCMRYFKPAGRNPDGTLTASSEHMKLLESIKSGLQCDISFVRLKYIKFVEMYVPYLKAFAKDHESFRADFVTIVKELLGELCTLLQRVDVSSFSSQKTLRGGATQATVSAAQNKDQIREPKNQSIHETKEES